MNKLPAKGEITEIRVIDANTGKVYARGLEFSVPAPPAGTLCRWEYNIKNIGDETGELIFHVRELEPYEADWIDQPIPVEPGQEAGMGARWSYPSQKVVWRFSAEREVAGQRIVDDSYLITATPTSLSSKHEVAPPAPPRGAVAAEIILLSSRSELICDDHAYIQFSG